MSCVSTRSRRRSESGPCAETATQRYRARARRPIAVRASAAVPESGERATILPEEVREVPELAQLGLNVERLVFLPAVDVTEDVGVSAGLANRGI